VVIQLLQPALHTLIGEVFGDVIDQQGSNCTSVISVRGTLILDFHTALKGNSGIFKHVYLLTENSLAKVGVL